jgi:hypothetical protein
MSADGDVSKSAAFSKIRRAFTLIEAVLALALFSMAAVVISQICCNCIFALDIADKSPLDDAVKDQIVAAVLKIGNYDELDDGVEIDGLDGETYKVYGYAEPTQILDLFELEIVCNRQSGEFRTKIFVRREGGGWYQDSTIRDELVKDRTDYLEDVRREWKPPTSEMSGAEVKERDSDGK